MLELGGIAFLVIVVIIVLIILAFAVPAAILGMLFSPCKIAWFVIFIVAKKGGVLKCSWWWILLGLLIPW